MDSLSWANAVAAAHLAAIVFMLTGGLLSWRWPRLIPWHVATAGAILAVNLAGLDCPLTTLELRLRAAAGEVAYSGGFIGHYLIEPLYAPGITAAVDLIIYAVALTPNVLAYGGLAWRHWWAASAPREPTTTRP
ncbi:MAG: DUF2784 domain-containing protein [Actinomycetota bacterium]|nr:DUF2784 domain-containing protein [Actinomycetota bacterium]MDP9462077.1 DUF2784 domain-containing protein [Actinomycetota bacterium]